MDQPLKIIKSRNRDSLAGREREEEAAGKQMPVALHSKRSDLNCHEKRQTQRFLDANEGKMSVNGIEFPRGN